MWRVFGGGKGSSKQLAPAPLDPNDPVGLQVPWWIALRGRDGSARVERAIIYASGMRWRSRIEQLKAESARDDGEPKNWSDIARTIRIHHSNLSLKGKSTHVSVLDVMLVAGVLGVPCSELIPESYARFLEMLTHYVCGESTSEGDLRAYAAYWATSPRNPRKGIDRLALSNSAARLSLDDEIVEAAIRRIAHSLEKHLGAHRKRIEVMIADGRLP